MAKYLIQITKKTLAIKEETLFLVILIVSFILTWVYNGDPFKKWWIFVYCIAFIFIILLELNLYFTNDSKKTK